ncbi:MAG: hypothetical protein HUJ71_03655 [Pseudobutyrivibrio sp.]|nr:hypothetical protein [Pseudobutyrivibrio sp.]
MKTTIIKMSNAYNNQDFYHKASFLEVVDCTDVFSTKCYCDDESVTSLRLRLSTMGYDGIHFIDSGNYHYLSLLFLEKIETDFNLILFDHHSDDQPPGFGDILSCGGWVLDAKTHLSHLKNVYSYGVGEYVSPSDIPTDIPVYISIDKDILSYDYAITDWDQGNMTLGELTSTLQDIFLNRDILGVDVCGDTSDVSLDQESINNSTNAFLFDFFTSLF